MPVCLILGVRCSKQLRIQTHPEFLPAQLIGLLPHTRHHVHDRIVDVMPVRTKPLGRRTLPRR
jgi:hypothetical protein